MLIMNVISEYPGACLVVKWNTLLDNRNSA